MATDLVDPRKLQLPLAGMAALPVVRQVGLLLGLAASVALGFYVVLWSKDPAYRMLYSHLSDHDAATVTQTLRQANIKYRVDPETGALLVEGDKIHEARMALAASGFSADGELGFELLDKEQGFGTSQFMQTARYQRALEGELARTVTSLAVVRSARVHLALPRQSTFIRDKREASASVFVELLPGRSLESGQVQAIVNLVANSVPNLKREQVTVVDQQGRLLTRGETDPALGLTASQFEYTRKLEKEYVRRIENILGPVVGLDNLRAQVAVDVDFTITEQTQELYNPDQPAVRSEQRFEETTTGEEPAQGVPGALSNTPPAAGRAPEKAAAAAAAGDTGGPPLRKRSRSTRNYELDRTISHTRRIPGAVRRLSVAVVVNHKPAPAAAKGKDKKGKGGAAQRVPLTDEEIKRLTALVKDAVGFNALRGDTVNVINVPFAPPPEVEPLPEPPLWKQPWVLTLAKQVAAGVAVLLVIFGVLRPVMRNLARQGEQQRAVVPAAGEEGEVLADDQVTLSGEEAPRLPRQRQGYQANLEMAKNAVQQDPKLVAQVIKNWVGNE